MWSSIDLMALCVAEAPLMWHHKRTGVAIVVIEEMRVWFESVTTHPAVITSGLYNKPDGTVCSRGTPDGVTQEDILVIDVMPCVRILIEDWTCGY